MMLILRSRCKDFSQYGRCSIFRITDLAWGSKNETKLPWNKDPEFYRSARHGMSVDNVISVCSAQENKQLRKMIGGPFARKFLFDREYIFKKCTKSCCQILTDYERNRMTKSTYLLNARGILLMF